MQAEMQDYIKRITAETISATTNELMKELKRHKLLKPNKDSSFQKAEKLLFNYNNFKKVIENKFKQIETIESEGLAKRSKSIVILSPNHSLETSTDAEKAEAKIEEIQASIDKINGYIRVIDDALDKISMDEYFELIELYYFEGKTREDVAEYFEVDVSTVTRHKNRLINTLKIYLFPDDSILEFFD